jgi:hypothetical protein
MALTPEMVVYMAVISRRQCRESPLVALFLPGVTIKSI